MFEIQNIISKVKKNLSRIDLLLVFILIVLFAVTRFVNLDKFPIFSDEGIYIHWAKVAWHDASWRFISLTDGKQPLQTWGTIPFLKLFPQNALLAGRLFSVATGFVGMAGFFTLSYYLFGKKTAFLGTLLYVLTPYFMFYDKLALVDSGVNAGFIWIFFLSLLLIRSQRFDVALFFGLISGLSLLAKSSVRVFLAISLLAPVVTFERDLKKTLMKIINYLVLFGIASSLALAIYNIQRLSPFFHYVAEKNKTFIMTLPEFLSNPFAVFYHNIKIIPEYVLSELGWVTGIFSAAGLYMLFKKNKGLFFYIFLWLIIPFFAIAFFSKVIYPRYLIFFADLLLILAIYFLHSLKNNKYKLFSIIAILASFLIYDSIILFKPSLLPFPEIDRGQYIEGATAVWGAQDVVEYVRRSTQVKPAIIIAEGSFGLVGDVLDVFTKPGDKIFIKGYWPLEEKDLAENQKELAKNKVFVVFAQRKDFPKNWPLKLISKYEKPGNKSTVYLFELTR